MCLSASLSSKNLKKWVQNGLKLKSGIGTIRLFWSADWHFWSAEWHFQSAEWHTFGPWPEGIGITLKHIIFNFLVIRTRPSSYSDCLSYFFEPSSHYK